MKFCSKCKEEKSLDEFHVDNRPASKCKVRSECKSCHLVQKKEYYHRNRTNKIEKQKLYNKSNRLKVNKRMRIYKREVYRKKPGIREKEAKYKREKMHSNIQFRISCYIRTRLYQAIKGKGTGKRGSAIKDLGCSISELKTYL